MEKRPKRRTYLIFGRRRSDKVPFGYIQFKDGTASRLFYSREKGKMALMKAVTKHQLTLFEGAKLAYLLSRFHFVHRLPSTETNDDGSTDHSKIRN